MSLLFKMKVKFFNTFRRFKLCAYCGKVLAWRYVWNVSPSIVHTGEDKWFGLALDLWPIKWRKINTGSCKCLIKKEYYV